MTRVRIALTTNVSRALFGAPWLRTYWKLATDAIIITRSVYLINYCKSLRRKLK